MNNVLENPISVITEKLRQIEIEVSQKKGTFNLFALIEREDSLGKWDLVISADWINNNQKQLIDMIAFRISNKLDNNEKLMLSRILILPSNDKFVQSLNLISVEHGNARLTNCTFNGILVREAILVTSKQSQKRVLKANEQPKK